MIYYRPTDGGPLNTPFHTRPRTCFLMTQLGGPIPPILSEIRSAVRDVLAKEDYTLIDADSIVTGRDFLLKIWEMIVAVPLGIAIVHGDMKTTTLANVFYELGLMQAYGKETLVIKTENAAIPSDFVRTEYIAYRADFRKRFRRFVKSLSERAEHYAFMSNQVERNPLLAIDYLRRAYLISREPSLKEQAREIFEGAGLAGRAKDSVEMLLINFD